MIAMEQQGGADADGKSADGGDQRLLVLRQRLEKVQRVRAQAAALRRLEKFADIGAGAEHALAAGEHETAYRLVRLRLAQGARHRRIHRLRQRVLLFRTVHPDDANGAVVGHDDGIGHGIALNAQCRPVAQCVGGRAGHY